MKYLKQLLIKFLGGRVRLIDMDEDRLDDVLRAMDKIQHIEDYWEFQKQMGYQLYGQTQDRKYLGIVELASTLLTVFEGFHTKPEKEEPLNNGYQSTL